MGHRWYFYNCTLIFLVNNFELQNLILILPSYVWYGQKGFEGHLSHFHYFFLEKKKNNLEFYSFKSTHVDLFFIRAGKNKPNLPDLTWPNPCGSGLG